MNNHAYESTTSATAWPAPADLHHRFGAFIIDWHIRTIPLALWGFWVFVLWFPGYWNLVAGGALSLDAAWQLLLQAMRENGVALTGWLCFIAYLLYHPTVELATRGDSPGKRMMGIKVVGIDGKPPTVRQVLLRNAWRALEFLPFGYLWGVIAMWRSPENARTGDVMAGTRVVMRRY